MSHPAHLTDWKVGLLILLWSDKSVSTKAIGHQLDLGARMLRHYVRQLGLGPRPIGRTSVKVKCDPDHISP